MKKISVLVATAVVALGIFATSCDSQKNVKLSSGVDSVSYSIGVNFGSGLQQNLKEIPGGKSNIDALIAGFITAIKADTSALKMTPQEAQTFINTYFAQVEENIAKEAKEEGDKFLAENKAKDGVMTTESGLQYKVVTEGTGAKPAETDKVKVHYTGTYLDGTQFDSSVERGEPAEFPLNGVIKGWTEGIQIMPVGSKYIFWIPAELAYGEQGSRGIKPNSTLKFEVELLDIVKEDAPAKK